MGDEAATQRAVQQQQRTQQSIAQQPSSGAQTAQSRPAAEGSEKAAASASSTAPHPSTAAPPSSSPMPAHSSSISPAAPPASGSAGTPGSAEAGREKVKLLFTRYHVQLTKGCGRVACANPLCRSSPAFVPPHDDSAKAVATRCLELTTQYKESGLCEHVNKDREERKATSSAESDVRGGSG